MKEVMDAVLNEVTDANVRNLCQVVNVLNRDDVPSEYSRVMWRAAIRQEGECRQRRHHQSRIEDCGGFRA